MGLPYGYQDPVDSREVGKLQVYRSTHWRTRQPMLAIFYNGRAKRENRASLEAGALGGTVLSYEPRTDTTFRAEVEKHRKQLDTLFILWR